MGESEPENNLSLHKACNLGTEKIKLLIVQPPFKIYHIPGMNMEERLKIPWGIGLIFKKTFKIKSFNQLRDHLSENILLQETVFIV